MRATINFDVDVDRVQETMGAVVREELQPLHQAMDLLEVSKPHDLHRGISEALEILGAVANQLEQYRDMLASFEKARFETLLPQSAEQPLPVGGEPINSLGDLRNTMEKMKNLQGFLDRINAQEEEDTNDAPAPEEG